MRFHPDQDSFLASRLFFPGPLGAKTQGPFLSSARLPTEYGAISRICRLPMPYWPCCFDLKAYSHNRKPALELTCQVLSLS